MKQRFAALLLVFLMLLQPALAFSPTPSPSPMPTMPVEINVMNHLMNSFSVSFHSEGKWQNLPSHMLYSQTPQIMADGILHFMPLDKFVEMEEIPSARLSPDFRIQTLFSDALTSANAGYALYRKNDEGLESYSRGKPVFGEVESGLYLLVASHSLSVDGGHYSGQSLLWLEV